MKSIAISGSPRENVGKRDAKELRYGWCLQYFTVGKPKPTLQCPQLI